MAIRSGAAVVKEKRRKRVVHELHLVRAMFLLPAFGIASFGAGVAFPSSQIVDLTGTKTRISDLEPFCDHAEPASRPLSPRKG